MSSTRTVRDFRTDTEPVRAVVRRYRSGWWLEQKYRGEGLTQREIAEECGVSARTIRTWMNRRGVETRDLTGENHPLYGTERDPETREPIADSLVGREFDEATRRRMAEAHVGNEIRPEIREKISETLSGTDRSESTRRKMSESTAGPANPNWKGGYSRRYGEGWSIARESVRRRDEVCQRCGHDGADRRLEVHHRVPVRAFREADDRDIREAHDLANLVLLCRRCHGKVDHGEASVTDDVSDPHRTDD